jgi:hypothetical protein
VADRYQIFLYFHDMGPGFDTTPFGRVTVTRYWMSGLVAAGAVMIPYLALNLILGRLATDYRGPSWWRLWLLTAAPLLVIIPAIVMTLNDPVLPLGNAAQVTLVTLVGLAFGLHLGESAARRPVAFVILMVDGLAMACLLSSLPRFESYPRWLSMGRTDVIYRHLAVLSVGLALLAIITAFHGWCCRYILGAGHWIVAGVDITYLFLPLYHHLFWCSDDGSWTDPDYFHYMPDADNYSALSPLIQIAVWMAVAALAVVLTRLRRRLCRRPGARQS